MVLPGVGAARGFALGLLLVVVGLGCAVDRRPPFSSAPYFEAFQRIDHGPGPEVGAGPFRAGWAKVELQVPVGTPLAGYGERRGAPSIGQRDPVYVRALALAAGEVEVVLLASDLLLLDPHTTEAIVRAAAGSRPKAALFFTASHTHSGPGAYAEGPIWELVFGAYAEAARSAVIEAHLTAIRRALADLAPAKIGAAELRGPTELIQNRIERGGPVDPWLFVLTAERDDGRRAAFWTYACHAVTLPAENLAVSADYPGQVAAAFEGHGVELLAFAAGGVGSSNPARESKDTTWLVTPLRRLLERALPKAQAQARSSGRLAYLGRTVPLPPLRYRVGPEWMIPGGPVRLLTGLGELELRALALDDVVLLQLPVELSGALSRTARARARRAGLKLAITPFNGTYAGYVVPRRVYDLPEERQAELHAYETQAMTFFGPYGADLFLNYGMRLAARVRSAALGPDSFDAPSP